MIRRLIILLVLVSCTDSKTVVDPNATAIEAVVHLDPSLGIDQVRVTSTLASYDGTQAFAPGTLPDTPRPLTAQESFAVLVSDALDGMQLAIRIDGLSHGAVVASGGALATVTAHKVTPIDVPLGAPAICGDGLVRDPLEQCDDANTAASDGCSSTCFVEPGWICTNATGSKSTCNLDTFVLVGASSSGNHSATFTFSAPPDPAQATTLANYSIPGLTLSGTPFLSGNTVTVTTSAQSAIGYNAIVSNVTRASDAKALSGAVATFVGRTSFNVASAASTSATKITVTFDAPPAVAQATTLANYSIPGLTLSGTPSLSGDTVTLTTSNQSATSYTVDVLNVTRATDDEPLATAAATFSGNNGFDVAGAASTSNREMTVTFNAPPNAAQATALSSYSVPGLTLSGTPSLSGNTVTIATSAQMAVSYTVTVTGVTRASDGQALGITSASFTGKLVGAPTVTAAAVIATSPNNGTIPYNTGTATVQLTGTNFTGVMCPTGVKLDDLDGLGLAANTQAASCTVNSDTQITATFPAGIRTNSSIGWDVIVTNSAGSNPTSAKFVPVAGILISEPYTGSSTSGTTHEFIELYNPTSTSIDAAATGIGLSLHVRSATGSDVAKPLTFLNKVVPSHGYLLVVSQQSTAADPWFAHRDATYAALTADLVPNGGAYISLSATANAKVIDKVGWGTQPAGGYEGTALADIPADESAERLPGGTQGHATDSDNNSADFLAPSTAITPSGTVDPPQP